MPTTAKRQTPKRSSLNIRIQPETRRLIDRAARAQGKNRTDFMLEASCRAAEEALLDQKAFTVSSKAYADFLKRLEASPKPNERLEKTMRTQAPWEKL